MIPFQTYINVKRYHPNDVVFIKVGDRYHAYRDDALDAAQILDMEVDTMLDPNDGGRVIPHIQFPAENAEDCARKFIMAGKGVIMMESTQNE